MDVRLAIGILYSLVVCLESDVSPAIGLRFPVSLLESDISPAIGSWFPVCVFRFGV